MIRSCDAESGSGRVAKRRSDRRPPSVLGCDLVSRLQEADRPRIPSSDDREERRFLLNEETRKKDTARITSRGYLDFIEGVQSGDPREEDPGLIHGAVSPRGRGARFFLRRRRRGHRLRRHVAPLPAPHRLGRRRHLIAPMQTRWGPSRFYSLELQPYWLIF